MAAAGLAAAGPGSGETQSSQLPLPVGEGDERVNPTWALAGEAIAMSHLSLGLPPVNLQLQGLGLHCPCFTLAQRETSNHCCGLFIYSSKEGAKDQSPCISSLFLTQ